MNSLQLIAQIIERDIVRYTPAGIPVISARLQHAFAQTEAHIVRQIEFEIPALAVGEIVGRFEQAVFGQPYQFHGFLARKTRKSKTLVFHLLDLNEVTEVAVEIPANTI